MPTTNNQNRESSLPPTILVDGVVRPTTNTANQPLHINETGIRNFWRWFGDSVAVDPQTGQPQLLFHGTDRDFDAFRKTTPFGSARHRTRGGKLAGARQMFFFTSDPEVASEFAGDKPATKKDVGPNVRPVYLRIHAPTEVDAAGQPWGKTQDAAIAAYDSKTGDSFIVRNSADGMKAEGNNSDVYVAFSSDQIVSAIVPNGISSEFDQLLVDGTLRAMVNSEGEPLHDTVEGIQNFWRWFKDSPLKDEVGRPRPFYHGTKSEFDSFAKHGIKPNYTSPQKHLGHFFTDSKKYAAAYAKGDSGIVLPVYLAIQNPAVESIEKIADIEDRGTHGAARDYKNGLAAAGHDGIMFSGETRAFGFVQEVAVFDPAHIKAAYTNTGAFNPASQNIHDAPSRIALGYSPDPVEKIAYYLDQNPERRPNDIVVFDDAVFFRQPDGSYIDDPRGEDFRDMKFDSQAEIKASAADMGLAVDDLQLKNSHRWMKEAGKLLKQLPPEIMVDGVLRPTRDSTGVFIHHDTKTIENFWRWMGNSAVLDEEGRPIVLHKGMEGDVPRINETTGMTHASTSDAIADQFSGGRGRKALYASVAKPFDFRNPEDTEWLVDAMLQPENLAEFNRQTHVIMGPGYTYEVEADEMRGAIEEGAYQVYEVGLVSNMIRARGYDGIYMLEEGQSRATPNLAVFAAENLLLPSRIDAMGADPSRWPPSPTLPQATTRTIDVDGVHRPTTNSLGSPIHATEDGIRNFWRWYKDSTLVDDAGRPVVYFRGQSEAFNDYPLHERYFTSDPSEAATYGGDSYFDDADQQNVLPVYINATSVHVEEDINRVTDYDWAGARHAELLEQGYDAITNTGAGIMVALKSANQVKSALGNNGDFDHKKESILFQSAYHGSPVRFEKFSTDFIGTGEGSQAFGWGLYFSGRQEVANWYRDNLSARQGADPTNSPIEGKTIMEWYHHFERQAQEAPEYIGELYDRMSMLEDVEINWNAHGAMNSAIEDGLDPSAIEWFSNTIVPHFNRPGATYTVSIPDDNEMLLWDEPLNKAHHETFTGLKEAIAWLSHRDIDNAEREALISGEMVGGLFYRVLSREVGKMVGPGFADRETSQYLHALGIKGLKHLDIDARQTGEPNYNYVVFDDSDVSITEILFRRQKGQPAQAAHAQVYIQEVADHTSYAISIFKTANAVSFAHELSHVFLDMYEKIEKYPDSPPVVKNDMEIIRQWAGLPPGAPLTDAAQEKFATATEDYLARGVEPSPELSGVFGHFKRWMAAVYDAFKQERESHLSPEIIGVLDRMLGSDILPAATSAKLGDRLAMEATSLTADLGRPELTDSNRAAGRLADAFHDTLVARGLDEHDLASRFSISVVPSPMPGAKPQGHQAEQARVEWSGVSARNLKTLDDALALTEQLKRRGVSNGFTPS